MQQAASVKNSTAHSLTSSTTAARLARAELDGRERVEERKGTKALADPRPHPEGHAPYRVFLRIAFESRSRTSLSATTTIHPCFIVRCDEPHPSSTPRVIRSMKRGQRSLSLQATRSYHRRRSMRGPVDRRPPAFS